MSFWAQIKEFEVETSKNVSRVTLQLLKLRFTAMVTYSFYLYPRSLHNFILCFIFSTQCIDLACSQCMGLHSSAGRALQRERRGHGFESR